MPYKLEHDREGCIGCGACAAIAPERWDMDENDGKSDIKDGKDREDGWQEIEIQDSELEINKDAAESCPVNVIHITDLKTKEKLI